MPEAQADLEAELAELRTRRRTIAGVKSTAFSDQATTFDADGLDRRIAQIERQLTVLTGGSTTRYAATRKGV